MPSDADAQPELNHPSDGSVANIEPAIPELLEITNGGSTALPKSFKMPKIISFNDLCRCGDEIWIEHEKQVYRLRKTKQGKLILTK